jgi:hypothetical protein
MPTLDMRLTTQFHFPPTTGSGRKRRSENLRLALTNDRTTSSRGRHFHARIHECLTYTVSERYREEDTIAEPRYVRCETSSPPTHARHANRGAAIAAPERRTREWDEAHPGMHHDPDYYRRENLPRLAGVKLGEVMEAAAGSEISLLQQADRIQLGLCKC